MQFGTWVGGSFALLGLYVVANGPGGVIAGKDMAFALLTLDVFFGWTLGYVAGASPVRPVATAW